MFYFFRSLDRGKFDVLYIAEALLAVADEGNVVAADAGHFRDFHFHNGRQAKREDTLYPDAAGHLADGHRFAACDTTHFQDNPFVYLHTLLFLTVRSRFLNLLVDANSHPRADLGGLNDSWKGDLVGHRWRQEYEKMQSTSRDYGVLGFSPDNWSNQVWIR